MVWTLVTGMRGRQVGDDGVVTTVKLKRDKRVQYCQVRMVSINHSWVKKYLHIILIVYSLDGSPVMLLKQL